MSLNILYNIDVFNSNYGEVARSAFNSRSDLSVRYEEFVVRSTSAQEG